MPKSCGSHRSPPLCDVCATAASQMSWIKRKIRLKISIFQHKWTKSRSPAIPKRSSLVFSEYHGNISPPQAISRPLYCACSVCKGFERTHHFTAPRGNLCTSVGPNLIRKTPTDHPVLLDPSETLVLVTRHILTRFFAAYHGTRALWRSWEPLSIQNFCGRWFGAWSKATARKSGISRCISVRNIFANVNAFLVQTKGDRLLSVPVLLLNDAVDGPIFLKMLLTTFWDTLAGNPNGNEVIYPLNRIQTRFLSKLT